MHPLKASVAPSVPQIVVATLSRGATPAARSTFVTLERHSFRLDNIQIVITYVVWIEDEQLYGATILMP